jgi:hypothetical protein
VVFTIRVLEFFALFPGAMLELGQIALPLILLYYALLFAWTFARPSLRARLSNLKPAVALLGLGQVTILVWRSVLVAPDRRLHLEMLDVGSGDAFLIQTPTGRYLLVDGGPSTRALSDALGLAAIPIYTAEAGQALDLGQSARMMVLGTSRSGAVLLLEWRNFRALLPIGLDEDL